MTGSRPRAWTPARLREALETGHGVTHFPAHDTLPAEFPHISTDSRTLPPGALFVALRGERFDGHAHLAEVEARGGGAALVEVPEPGVTLPQIVVPDTLRALGDLAAFRRDEFHVPVVGITGSSGKTTTKELLRGALASTFRVHATEGNLNNRIGMPLTLLSAPEDAEVLILEMGTSIPGEIEALRKIARPNHVVLITVGEAHIEGLGGIEGVYREKLALLDQLPDGGVAVVGDVPEELPERARGSLGVGAEAEALRVAGFSERADPRWRGVQVGVTPTGGWALELPDGPVSLQVPGAHGAHNALLVWALAEALGVPFDEVARGMASVGAHGMRGAVRSVPGGTLLLDCYNANPQSTRASLRWLGAFPAPGRKIAVLGSMLELGPSSEALHAEVLADALSLGLSEVVATGAFAVAAGASGGARGGDVTPVDGEFHGSESETVLYRAQDPADATRALVARLQPGDVILLKGSRGVALERQIPALEEGLARMVNPHPASPDPNATPHGSR
jgi:UDP-N-acetylmuramoyl-tripeptide--D-alanyl-D-alanine ligase